MGYREVVIDGRVYLEIVDEGPDAPRPDHEDESRDDSDEVRRDRNRDVWIGELVPSGD